MCCKDDIDDDELIEQVDEKEFVVIVSILIDNFMFKIDNFDVFQFIKD